MRFTIDWMSYMSKCTLTKKKNQYPFISFNNDTFMKKISLIKGITIFLVVMFVSASIMQCKKEGDFIKDLDRSFKNTADSTIYA